MSAGAGEKTVQKVAIANHIWESYDEMAQMMGSDRENLVNQALFMYARLNGFLDGGGGNGASLGGGSAGRGGSTNHGADAGRAAAAAPAAAKAAAAPKAAPAAAPAAAAARPAAASAKEPVAAARGGGAAAAPSASARRRTLYIVTENGESQRVDKDRFLIGRDKKCDFCIESGKVSREHAVLIREADGWYLEDLNSSNGTWYRQERIDRKKIDDGDVFYICNEKLTLMFR